MDRYYNILVEHLFVLSSGLIPRLALLLLLIFFPSSSGAQGLIGFEPEQIHGRPAPLMKGDSDLQRYSIFQAVEGKLIGMTVKQLIAALGEGQLFPFDRSQKWYLVTKYKDHVYLEYQMTESTINCQKDAMASMHLQIELNHGIVKSYKLVPAFWNEFVINHSSSKL